jgi:hypothetical protein
MSSMRCSELLRASRWLLRTIPPPSPILPRHLSAASAPRSAVAELGVVRRLSASLVKTRIKSPLIFCFAAVLGALIWFLSPLLAGHAEPWDAQSNYYGCALIVAGFVPACFSAQRFWLVAVGAWLGQVVAFLFRVIHPAEPVVGADLWPVGLIFLCFYSLLSLAGAALGAGAHILLHRLFSSASKVA